MIPKWYHVGTIPNLTLRLTDQQHSELSLEAEANGRSLQREIIHRLFGGQRAELSEGDQGGIVNAGDEEVPQDRGTGVPVVLPASPSESSSPREEAVGELAVSGTAFAIGEPELPSSRPPLIKTKKDVPALVEKILAGRVVPSPDVAASPPSRSPRSAKKKVERGDGKCTAYAPSGTKCKICQKVHP